MIQYVTVRLEVKKNEDPFVDDDVTYTAKDVVNLANDVLSSEADSNFVVESVTLVDVE